MTSHSTSSNEGPHQEDHRLDAATIAGLTGGRGSTSGRDSDKSDYYNGARSPASSAASVPVQDDRDDHQRDARSDTGSGTISVLSDDLGDIYFTDDELDQDDEDGGEAGRRQLEEDSDDHNHAVAALTVEDDENEIPIKGEQHMKIAEDLLEAARPSRWGEGGGVRIMPTDDAERSYASKQAPVRGNEAEQVPAMPTVGESTRRTQQSGGDCGCDAPAIDKPPAINEQLAVDNNEVDFDSNPVKATSSSSATLAPSPRTSSRVAWAGAGGTASGIRFSMGSSAEAPAAERLQSSTIGRQEEGGSNRHNSRDPGGGVLKSVGSGTAVSSSGEGRVQVPTVTCKVLVVGNAKCGKSSIISRFVSNRFSPDYNSTVGADYAMKDVTLKDGRRVRLQLWDIAGQDRFAKLTRAYFRRAKGAVVVCDVTREGTFDAIVRWKEEIDMWGQNEGCELPVYLFANKSDLLTDVRDSFLAGAKMEKTCREAGFAGWHITSAKRGDNIEAAMSELLHDVLEIEAKRNRGSEGEGSAPGDATRHSKNEAFQLSNGGGTGERTGALQQACCA